MGRGVRPWVCSPPLCNWCCCSDCCVHIIYVVTWRFCRPSSSPPSCLLPEPESIYRWISLLVPPRRLRPAGVIGTAAVLNPLVAVLSSSLNPFLLPSPRHLHDKKFKLAMSMSPSEFYFPLPSYLTVRHPHSPSLLLPPLACSLMGHVWVGPCDQPGTNVWFATTAQQHDSYNFVSIPSFIPPHRCSPDRS